MSDRTYYMALNVAVEAKIKENADFLLHASSATLDELRERQGAIRALDEVMDLLHETYKQLHG